MIAVIAITSSGLRRAYSQVVNQNNRENIPKEWQDIKKNIRIKDNQSVWIHIQQYRHRNRNRTYSANIYSVSWTKARDTRASRATKFLQYSNKSKVSYQKRKLGFRAISYSTSKAFSEKGNLRIVRPDSSISFVEKMLELGQIDYQTVFLLNTIQPVFCFLNLIRIVIEAEKRCKKIVSIVNLGSFDIF